MLVVMVKIVVIVVIIIIIIKMGVGVEGVILTPPWGIRLKYKHLKALDLAIPAFTDYYKLYCQLY